MKTSTFFKVFIAFALLLIANSSLHAQVSNAQLKTRPAYSRTSFDAAKYEATNTETATVGAQMPYYVERDASVNGSFFNESKFIWNWSGITGVTDNAATPADITAGNETSNNFVIATMPASVPAGPGTVEISTQEVSKPLVGTGCTGTATKVTISIVDKPTVTFDGGSTGTCAADVVAVNLPLTLTGTAPFFVDYTISAVGMDGSTIVGSEKTYSATLDLATTKLLIDPTQLQDVAGKLDTDPQTSGKYTVTITKVWDKYSWKAINYDALAAVPATTDYDIYVYPTPTTKQIQHIKQL